MWNTDRHFGTLFGVFYTSNTKYLTKHNIEFLLDFFITGLGHQQYRTAGCIQYPDSHGFSFSHNEVFVPINGADIIDKTVLEEFDLDLCL